MKKAAIITGLVISLFTLKANAQVVSAGGVTIKLNAEQIAFLHRLKSPMIDSALRTCVNIKYNTTADVIIILLKDRKQKQDSLLLAGKKRK